MAGTRLFIQAVFLLEFCLVVAIAVYFGLCRQDDVLCRKALMHVYPGSQQHAMQQKLQSEVMDEATRIALPSLSVVTPASEMSKWKAAFEWIMLEDQAVVVTGDDETGLLSDLCEGNVDVAVANERTTKQHQIWICPLSKSSQSPKDVARIVVDASSGTAVVYPFRRDVSMIVKALYPSAPRPRTGSSQASPLRRRSLHIGLVVEDGMAWKSWGRALTELLDSAKNPFTASSLPCLDGKAPSTSLVIHGSLSESATRTLGASQNDTAVQYQVSQDQAKQVIPTKQISVDDSMLDVIIYVPSRHKMPLVVEGSNASGSSSGKHSTALAAHSGMVSIVHRLPSEEETQESYTKVVQEALSYVVPFLRTQCLGLPASLPKGVRVEPPSQGILPSWQVRIALQRILHETHQRAVTDLMRVQRYLLESSPGLAITQEVAQRWLDAADAIKEGLQHAQDGQWLLALDSLEASLRQSQSIVNDPNVMEPLDFPVEHYAAVFSPLLLPLALPLVAGLVREIKRYKKLRKESN